MPRELAEIEAELARVPIPVPEGYADMRAWLEHLGARPTRWPGTSRPSAWLLSLPAGPQLIPLLTKAVDGRRARDMWARLIRFQERKGERIESRAE